MTAPAASTSPLGCFGGTSATNRSPKSVVGSICARTSAGTPARVPGFMARVRRAPLPVASMARTSPTTTPRSFTSAPRCISLPTVPVSTTTGSERVNCLS